MRDSGERYEVRNIFNRRSFLIASAQTVLMGSLAARLTYLGVNRSSHYQTLADENRIKLQILLPKRGLIYDRFDKLLADNQPNYRLVYLPGFKHTILQNLTIVQELVGLEEYSIEEMAEEIKKSRLVTPFTIRQNLNWEEVCKIEVQAPYLPGIGIEKGAQRLYPTNEIFAHLIGYVQHPAEEDDVEKTFMHLPDFFIGKAGLEKEFDGFLRGQAGYKEIEVNAVRKVVRELSVHPGQDGPALHLSIDQRLQTFIAEQLNEYESAAAVVMDVHTGEVHALVSSPSFNPNLFTNGIRSRDWQKLASNPYGIMNNKAINGLYAPGSTFKMIVGLAGLASKRITPDHKIFCSGYIELNGHRYHCMHQHGSVNLVTALSRSCDVYFYEVAKMLGHDRIVEMAGQFGLGRKTGLQLPGEKKGLLPNRSWKLMKHHRNWTMGDTILMSIGQGYMLTTPLQLAVMAARMVNGGKAVSPTLLKTDRALEFESLDIPSNFLDIIQQGMIQAVNQPGGTAFNSRIITPGQEMGGKTGTSQVRRISRKERLIRVLRNDELPWQERDHSLFVGYAPIHSPKYSVSVVVEHGGGGARIAAKIVKSILEYVQQL